MEKPTGTRRWGSFKPGLASRLDAISRECFGDGDGSALAHLLEIPHRTVLNYFGGCTIPGEILLAIIVITGANPSWLLSGAGAMFHGAGPSCPEHSEADGTAC